MAYHTDPDFSTILRMCSNVDFKVNHKYRIATNSTKTSKKRRCSSLLLLEGRPKDSPKAEKTDANILSKSQIDVELLKMRCVTAQEVAAAATKAAAEAEAAIAEAETAAREAEAARVIAKAAMNALKCRRLHIWIGTQDIKQREKMEKSTKSQEMKSLASNSPWPVKGKQFQLPTRDHTPPTRNGEWKASILAMAKDLLARRVRAV